MSRVWRLILVGLLAAALARAEEPRFEIGGPLEGPPLPLFPTQCGEEPGHPGCIPELMAHGKVTLDGETEYVEWANQGLWPQRQLYPGSIENYRAYWLKYVPVRSVFDAGSLIRHWTAAELPGIDAARIADYAAPIYWVPRHEPPKPTGRRNAPVRVVRAGVRAPVFDLDLGALRQGMYVVRVVGAVDNGYDGVHRRALYVAMRVNDGPGGASTTYRLRAGFVDEFYSVAEIYFHAPEERGYTAQLWVDDGSAVELLVHTIDLHDVLAGTQRRAVKTAATLVTPEARQALRAAKGAGGAVAAAITNMEQRLALDATLWQSLPPLNAQLGGMYGLNRGYAQSVVFGADGKSMATLAEEFGEWTSPRKGGATLLVNNKLGLTYTLDDLAALRPLPDPYPVKDRGAGVVTPPAQGGTQQEFTVTADAAVARFNVYFRELEDKARRYHETGDAEAGWSAALQLCRTAWQFPSLDGAQTLGGIVTDPGGFEQDYRCRRRNPSLPIGGGNGFGYDAFPVIYDQVFDVIQGNAEFARSLARFVPWVKTPEDVVALVDVYLMQIYAKRILRYNFLYDNEPTMIVRPAAVLADRSLTDPWMAWLFAKAYIYPNPPAGLGDIINTGNDADGAGYIGSWSYCLGEQAGKNGVLLQDYVRAGGNPRYDVTDPAHYPKVAAAAYWSVFRSRLAGLAFPRIGDVGGPDKDYGYMFDASIALARPGWQWTRDPAFAYVLRHYLGRQGESDAEWQAIEAAAATTPRAPWLENRSRVLPNWFGALESGTQHDDFRFRRAVMLRIGQGYGHQHDDTLDLQIVAHGLPMTIDGGQRPGYSKPPDRMTRLHNVVEVDGQDWIGHAWVRTLSDAEGARYLLAEAVPPVAQSSVRRYRRQVALIDVDEGRGGPPLTPAQQRPNAVLDPDVVTPNSYVLDVVRVAGGRVHTYCFHAMLEDELVTNIEAPLPYAQLPTNEQAYVSVFRDAPIEGYPIAPQRVGGDAPDVLQATWRMAVEIPGTGLGEKEMARGIWRDGAPRKYTRLHLFDQKGARAFTGWAWCRQWSYGYNVLMAQHAGPADAESVFAALIEPYAGEPFIVGRRALEIVNNDADASRAVALEVVTTNGHTDLCFADGRADAARVVRSAEGDVQVSGEFAYVSVDRDGLRQASLTGGTLLETPRVTLAPIAAERTGTVVSVQFADRRIEIDAPWPAGAAQVSRTFEAGTPEHWTTHTIQAVEAAQDGRAALTTLRTAALFQSRVLRVDASNQQVICALGLPHLAGDPCPGVRRQLVASNGDASRSWRAEYLGRAAADKEYAFRLDGPVSEADFGPEATLKLWDYGVGDGVRQATFASLRRVEADVYALSADVDLRVALTGRTLELSADAKEWRTLDGSVKGGKVEAQIVAATQLPSGTAFLRVR